MNHIEVQLEDLLLAKAPLGLQRVSDLPQLAQDGAVLVEEELAHQLHRQRASAVAIFAHPQVPEQGAHQLIPVDAAMVVERVLLAQHGVNHMR